MSKSFFEQVYDQVRKIPVGSVTTYGEIAQSLGTKDARKIGWALHANPHQGEVPCHRVVNKLGGLAPNFAFDGPAEQRARLKLEDVPFRDSDHVDLTKSLYLYGD